MTRTRTKILIVAGETSGDQYGGGLAQALREAEPDVQIRAMGGAALAAAGAEIVQDIRGLDVMGFWDVLVNLRRFRQVFRALAARLDTDRPDVVVLIDYPGFNLRLAREAHARGIKVVYFISPKVWAWNAGRIKDLARYCDRMLTLFEFELDVYKESGLETVWVGHPLAEELEPLRNGRERCRAALGIAADAVLVGLLPGSRTREIKRMFPAMLDAAARLAGRPGGCVFAAGCAPQLDEAFLRSFIRPRHPEIAIVKGQTRELIAASDAMIITSGTATLEAGIIGIPHVLCYKVGLPTYLLVKPMLRTADVGIVNIAAGKRIMPELVQFAMTPANIAAHIERFLSDPAVRARAAADLDAMRARLIKPGVMPRAAREILDVAHKETLDT